MGDKTTEQLINLIYDLSYRTVVGAQETEDPQCYHLHRVNSTALNFAQEEGFFCRWIREPKTGMSNGIIEVWLKYPRKFLKFVNRWSGVCDCLETDCDGCSPDGGL